MRIATLAGTTAAAAAVLAFTGACGSDAAADTVAVTATDTECEVAATELAAGTVTFAVTNKGSQVTEVYLYAEQDGAFTRIVSEVENIGPGTSRDMTVDVAAGDYEVACKPGQTGDGIRTRVAVTGEGGEGGESEAGYDREIEIEVTADGAEGLDGLTAATGERIEFKLENEADATRVLEVVDPSGTVVAEVEAAAGTTAEIVVPLGEAGTWTLKVEGDGVEEIEGSLTVS